MTHTAIEIAVQDLEGVRIALGEGADRIELCSALTQTGGLTPSPGLIEAAAELARDAGRPGFVNVLVRPRAGDFVYGADDLDIILRDIRQLRELGVAGVVVGVLDERGRIDLPTVEDLTAAAGPLVVTFHRAIDTLPGPADAVARLAGAGARRILTSGGARATIDGLATLKLMVAAAAGRIEIMAGGGVRVHDIPTLVGAGVHAIHLSAKRSVVGGDSGPGGGDTGYFATDAATVRAAVEAAHRADA